MTRTINKPLRVTRKTATPTNHILTNHINLNIKTAVFKIDILDLFPLCITSLKEKLVENKYTYLHKRG